MNTSRTHRLCAIAAFTFGLVMLISAAASADAFGVRPARNGYVTVFKSNGGYENEFEATVKNYIRLGVHLEIAGRCISACTTAVEYMRLNGGKVCVLPGASFGFHMRRFITDEGVTVYSIPEYRESIIRWVWDNGGWNTHEQPIVWMPFSVLATLYPVCRI